MACRGHGGVIANIMFMIRLLVWCCAVEYSVAVQDQQVLRDSSGGGTKRVAIIGAGSAGASAAYYIRKYASEANLSTSITVYESSDYVGGRSTTVNVYSNTSEPVELGASIFVEVNKNLVSAAKEFGLDVSSLHVRDEADDSGDDDSVDGLGVWNGQEFVFTQSDKSSYWWNIAKLIWRYGLSPIRTQNLMKSTVAQFLKMYEAPFFPFQSLSDVALVLDLTKMTSSTGEQALEEHGIGKSFAMHIVQASTRVNYGQNLALIHGLETMVCMAASGAMAVKGGNWQIFAEMIKAADADLRLNTPVYAIERQSHGSGSKGRFRVKSRTLSVDSTDDPFHQIEEKENESFDAVVLAAPFQFSNITISPPLDDGDHKSPDAIPYVTLHVTLFASPHKLSPAFFNLSTGSSVPRVVLTTLGKDDHPGSSQEGVGSAGFFSISLLRVITNYHPYKPTTTNDNRDEHEPSPRKEYLYKIFSPKPISDSFLRSLLGLAHPHSHSELHGYPPFGVINGTDNTADDAATQANEDGISKDDISWKHEKTWHSYPYLYPRVTFEDIRLEEKLFYTSGIESFISTMETSSLMGMNVARLLVGDLAGKD